MSTARRTSTVTFRIDEAYEKALRSDAESKKVTLNTLANQIFGQYVEWLRFAEKFGVVVLSKQAFRAVLNSLDERSMADIAGKTGRAHPRSSC